MESFSLLKYWRCVVAASMRAATITTTFLSPPPDFYDDGPFFDLELSVPMAVFDDSVAGPDLRLSHTVDLLKGNLIDLNSSPDSDFDSKPPFSISLRNSITKLRVLVLGFKKPKSVASDKDVSSRSRFFVRFKIEEMPIVSLFARFSSLKRADEEERRLVREVMQKYLSRIKPLYVKVSKLRLSDRGVVGEIEGAGKQRAAVKERVMVACKRLGNGRSTAPAPRMTAVRRSEDSLMQEMDGIQSAIAHCKRSFNGDPVTVSD